MRFSERYGYTPIREAVQLESMDEALRNGLWNVFTIHCLNKRYPSLYQEDEKPLLLCHKLWDSYFKRSLDTLSSYWSDTCDELRKYFFSCEWYQVYDFIEFVADNYERDGFKQEFTKACNQLFEREMSAYCFVGGQIIPIIDTSEIAAIEQAVEDSDGPVAMHLRRAIELFADRQSPDYRNTIKEAISAVESLVQIKMGKKGTLGKLLKSLGQPQIHSALSGALETLYGYTNDSGGIRHALTDGHTPDFHDAKFMLVACSAFINFVSGKWQTTSSR